MRAPALLIHPIAWVGFEMTEKREKLKLQSRARLPPTLAEAVAQYGRDAYQPPDSDGLCSSDCRRIAKPA